MTVRIENDWHAQAAEFTPRTQAFIYVNCWGPGDISLPFGGYKESGTGRDKSLHALDNYLQLKSTYISVSESGGAAG